MTLLSGLKVVEFASLGPGPFCAMMLARSGAEVTRIEKPGGRDVGVDLGPHDILLRGRSGVLALDLKSEQDRELALRACSDADVVLEGFRPGAMERLGLGPDDIQAMNPSAVYARITGYGQDGPNAPLPGHDINYIAETGALYCIGSASEPPPPPLSLVGDFGGGGMYAAFSIAAAVREAGQTGRGRVLDVSMQDGATLLMATTYSLINAGMWTNEREANLLDGGAPFYRCYQTSDNRHIAVGAIENRFYRRFLELIGFDDGLASSQMDRRDWPRLRTEFAGRIRTQPMSAWCDNPCAREACVSPVLTPQEAAALGRNRLLVTRQNDILIRN